MEKENIRNSFRNNSNEERKKLEEREWTGPRDTYIMEKFCDQG